MRSLAAVRLDLAALCERGDVLAGAERQRLDGHGRLAPPLACRKRRRFASCSFKLLPPGTVPRREYGPRLRALAIEVSVSARVCDHAPHPD